MATRHSLPALQQSDFASAFPNSKKVYVEAGDLRVPMREISLGGGEPALRVYDTSGPQGHDIREGLPLLRQRGLTPAAMLPAGRAACRSCRLERPR